MKGTHVRLRLEPWVKHEIEAIVSVVKGVREKDLRELIIEEVNGFLKDYVQGNLWVLYRLKKMDQSSLDPLLDHVLGIDTPSAPNDEGSESEDPS